MKATGNKQVDKRTFLRAIKITEIKCHPTLLRHSISETNRPHSHAGRSDGCRVPVRYSPAPTLFRALYSESARKGVREQRKG